MSKFLAGCHYNEEEISQHLKKEYRILAGPNSWQQVCNRSNPEKAGRSCEGADFSWLRALPPFPPTVTPMGVGRGGSRHIYHHPPGNPKHSAGPAIQAALDGSLVCKFGTLQSLTDRDSLAAASKFVFLVAWLTCCALAQWCLLGSPAASLAAAPRISLCAGPVSVFAVCFLSAPRISLSSSSN
jgi:hypothetical protein